jgi:hypothetical protein
MVWRRIEGATGTKRSKKTPIATPRSHTYSITGQTSDFGGV